MCCNSETAMKQTKTKAKLLIFGFLVLFNLPVVGLARDLPEVLEAGVLRHLGIPYANFVTGSGDGFDVEIVQGFARHLGVKYQFVASDWSRVLGQLTGRQVRRGKNGAELLNAEPIVGDIIATGMTVLPWRKEVVNFSNPTFPSAVWLLARADSSLQPIKPSGEIVTDIDLVKQSLDGQTVLTLKNTCLDPNLYQMSQTKAVIKAAKEKFKLNEMAPAIINYQAETTLLDVPDALIALEKWPGELKVIGPISKEQMMGAAFHKDSIKLRTAFNQYLAEIRANGHYQKIVHKYYPTILMYYADFFASSEMK